MNRVSPALRRSSAEPQPGDARRISRETPWARRRYTSSTQVNKSWGERSLRVIDPRTTRFQFSGSQAASRVVHAVRSGLQGNQALLAWTEAMLAAARLSSANGDRFDPAAPRRLVMEALNASLDTDAGPQTGPGRINLLQLKEFIAQLGSQEQQEMLRCGVDAASGRAVHAPEVTRTARSCLIESSPGIPHPYAHVHQTMFGRVPDAPPAPARHEPHAVAEVIPSRDEVIRQVGRTPLDDRTLFGITLHRRDTAYKGFLKKLDDYRNSCEQPVSPRSSSLEKTTQVGAALEALLGHLMKHAEAKDRLGQVMAAHVPHFRAESAMFNMIGKELAEGRGDEQGDTQAARDRIRSAAGPLFELAAGPNPPLTFRQAEGAMLHGLPLAAAMRCATLDPTAEPVVPFGSGSMNTVGRTRVKLPGGAPFPANGEQGVYKKELSFSPDADFSVAALASGIPRQGANMSLRNVATWNLDRHLGLGVTAETHLVLNGRELGSIMTFAPGMPPLALGHRVVEDLDEETLRFLEGRPQELALQAQQMGFTGAVLEGKKLVMRNVMRLGDEDVVVLQPMPSQGAIDYADGLVRREITKMQLLDALAGQADRNPQNYFVKVHGDGRVQVTAIDNDIAFGSADGMGHPDTRPGEYAPKLPEVLDGQTARRFLALEDAHVQRLCEGLMPAEIAATKSRLGYIKAHIEGLKKDGGIIEDDEHAADAWASDAVAAKLGIPTEADFRALPPGNAYARAASQLLARAATTSYVARERATQLASAIGLQRIPVFDVQALERGLRATAAS